MQLSAVHPILEARDAAGGAAEAPTPRPAVVAVDLVKTYGSGEAAVTALGGVSASFTAGPTNQRDRPRRPPPGRSDLERPSARRPDHHRL